MGTLPFHATGSLGLAVPPGALCFLCLALGCVQGPEAKYNRLTGILRVRRPRAGRLAFHVSSIVGLGVVARRVGGRYGFRLQNAGLFSVFPRGILIGIRILDASSLRIVVCIVFCRVYRVLGLLRYIQDSAHVLAHLRTLLLTLCSRSLHTTWKGLQTECAHRRQHDCMSSGVSWTA